MPYTSLYSICCGLQRHLEDCSVSDSGPILNVSGTKSNQQAFSSCVAWKVMEIMRKKI